MDLNIPDNCSPQQLFQDAEEVLTLQTDLAALETQFRQYYLQFYSQVPQGMTSEHAVSLFIESKIQDTYPDFWVTLDTKRARYKGLIAKARLIEAATRVATYVSMQYQESVS